MGRVSYKAWFGPSDGGQDSESDAPQGNTASEEKSKYEGGSCDELGKASIKCIEDHG